MDNDFDGKCKCYRYDNNTRTLSERYLLEDGDDIFIRYNELVSVSKKVKSLLGTPLSNIVSAAKAYGLRAEVMRNTEKYNLPPMSDKPVDNGYSIFGLVDGRNRGWKYISENYPLPRVDNGLFKYKVFVAEAYGSGEFGEIPSQPFSAGPKEICTETFLQIGPFETKIEADNLIKYIKTKFFRAMVGIKKQTQHTTQKVYQMVPLQDFTDNSDIDWSKSIKEIDQQLYAKYNLTPEEIVFIETNVKEMD